MSLSPHIGHIHILLPLKLFLDCVDFPPGNVTSRVSWKIYEKENSKTLMNG